ncbi:YwqG family protein [Hymenobacter crusticola]|uniref:DUF1963 domain-containing protein n=1 Tax=Hymenobacter crusticola TaxID=1770526 RepID=A0A243WGB8_9BACT|nr:YwqG family protein [Hymenobacter crusticola]OUJ74780.1 hypothetical protein BXP70_08460 [Hymenobacter crusticola]
MTKTELVEKLKEQDLIQHWESIKAVSRPCVRLQLVSEAEEDIPLGCSKIGGKPDLPAPYSWQNEQANLNQQGAPLSFVAQINLAEISTYDEQALLPKQGMLYFFFSADQEAWGYDSKSKGKFNVMYYDGEISGLRRLEFPKELENYARFDPCIAVPQQEISLPSWETNLLEFMTEAEQDVFFEIEEEDSINKMLGYADPVQNDMELECELVTNGIYYGDPAGYDAARAAELEPNAVDWRLLLQVDSNEECSMMWGDVGRIYFWIKEQDLLAKNFDKCWVILQCC